MAVSLALNIVTPSTIERMVWAPVAFVLLLCSLVVADRQIGGPSSRSVRDRRVMRGMEPVFPRSWSIVDARDIQQVLSRERSDYLVLAGLSPARSSN